MRPLRLATLSFLGAVALSPACSTHSGPSVPLRLAGNADPVTRCASASATEGERLSTVVSKVRVTLLARGSDGATIDFCDKLLDFPGSAKSLRLPAAGASSVDLYVEAYGPADAADPSAAGHVRRVAFGSLLGVPPEQATLGALRLFPSEAFACNPTRATFPRAFHTATLLPDGRVLFVGGLVGDPTNAAAVKFPTDGARVTGVAELFDPRTQTSTLVQESPPGRPRAFHSAALLAGNGPCPAKQVAVLLVGGIAPPTATPDAPVLNPVGGAGGNRLVPANKSAQLPVQAVGNEVLCLDPATNSATRVSVAGDPSMYGASAVTSKSLAVAGGNLYDFATLNLEAAQANLTVFPLDGSAQKVSSLVTPRIAPTFTSLGDGRGLVWGGGRTTDPVGEIVSGLDGTPLSADVSVTGALVTRFHTATLISDQTTPTVLVTGGFEVNQKASDPPIASSAVRQLTIDAGVVSTASVTLGGGYPPVASCTDPARYRPAGWESALPLPGGRVIVAGGTPSSSGAPSHCQDCPGVASQLCASGQASVYERGQLSAANPLQVPRFGHAMTRLADGSILVSGGIGNQPVDAMSFDAVFLTDLEIYNGRPLVPVYDATTTPIDPDDPIAVELKNEMLVRAPGMQAVTVGATKPAKSCGNL
ncbi:MAG: hypothetical protein ABI321_24325 [Polyangia bacterium]